MTVLDLTGSWTLRLAGPDAHQNLQGEVSHVPLRSERPIAIPGDILSALLASGEVPDPYKGQSELHLQWIGRKDWLLEYCFDLDAQQLSSELLCIELEAIDTIASLELNGVSIGNSRNMFVPFWTDIRQAARIGRNTLRVTIHSPEKAALEAAKALPYPIPASTYPIHSPHRNLIRKAQCMSGWDWGPCLMTGGIYGTARVLAVNGPWLARANAEARKDESGWLVSCELEITLAKPQRIILKAELGQPLQIDEADLTDTIMSAARLTVDAPEGNSIHRLKLRIDNPELWWPAGQGGQPLYPIKLSAEQAEAAPQAERATLSGQQSSTGEQSIPGGPGCSTQHKLIGFRELRLINEDDGHAASGDKSMVLEINQRRIFLKGANWIPQDALPSRWNPESTEKLLDSALAANMNSIRVWGGGRYESDEFYDYCDRKGILVWQDFMFSCATYPASPDFLQNVAEEVKNQIQRLRDHPSLAIWCGNNEDLGAINWYEESRCNPARYIVDYDRLNEGTVGRLVRELDPHRPWWPSSPSAGPGNYADNWHADGSGDMHYWSVWHEGKPFSAYLEVQPRFCSEFGFQSLPSAQTAAGFTELDQRNLTSPVMEHHQRHPRGNEIILGTMLRYFRMPGSWEETLYLSQVQQALAIRTAVDWWRSTMPRCMGILYWQLNDVWPCASWSSLEYGGRWKLLHHEARRFFAPIAPVLVVKDGKLQVSAVNDSPDPWAGHLELRMLDFTGKELEKRVVPVTLAPLCSPCLLQLSFDALPAPIDSCFCVAELRTAGSMVTQTIPRAWTFLTEPKRCALARTDILVEAEEAPDGRPSLKVQCDAPAFWTTLELPVKDGPEGPQPRGEFDDAGFLLLPGETKIVRYQPAPGEQPLPLKDFKNEIVCRHL